jgi:hypothetical protein
MILRSIGTRRHRRPLLVTPDELVDLVARIVSHEAARGLKQGSECAAVLAAVTRFGGWRYRITREMRQGLIDCSTLISQSHWDGAAVAIPFVAETQRIAYNASDVLGSSRWLPGDVLVRYASREASPSGRHNHVALYAGRDADGERWMIESKAPYGVRAVPVDHEAIRGGVRRFLPHPLTAFEDNTALRLARAVPKLGRLGARLTASVNNGRRHRGVDVYFSTLVDVLSPINGVVSFSNGGIGRPAAAATIVAGDGDVVVLSPLTVESLQAREVERHDVLGRLACVVPIGCNAIPGLVKLPRLHIEYWSRRTLSFHHDRELRPSPSPLISDSRQYRAYNPLYALKLGELTAPVSPADVEFATLALPLESG